MSKKFWNNKENTIGVVRDDDNETLTLFAGNTALELNGKEGKIALSGAIREMSGGDKTEEGLLRKNTLVTAIIPSTMATPIPQATLEIPIGPISGVINDIATMMSLIM